MIYVFLANGFEEAEAIAPIDILRRKDFDVTVVGVGGTIIKGSHEVPVVTDLEIDKINKYNDIDMIVLPGGMPGTLNLEASPKLQEIIKYCVDNNIYIGAICAAPSILGHKGYLNGRNAVCFDGFETQLTGANVLKNSVCIDGNIITAHGFREAIEFGDKLVEVLTLK